MPLMEEAIPLEDFERQRRGLPPLKKKVEKKPEPEKPEIKNEIKFEDIPLDSFMELEYAKPNTLKNKEGTRFIGYDVSIILNPQAVFKRKAGRPPKNPEENVSEEPKVLKGWMNEGNFIKFTKHFGQKINPNVVQW